MERIRLDIIPKGLMPVCHASQYDAGRVIRLDLMDGLQGYSLTDEEIELDVRKPDGHIVTASVDVVAGKTFVDIVTTEQMCAVEGENICELKISKDGAEIYSLNFRMMVEKSVTEGGDPSESFIHNLNQQIYDAVADQYEGNVIFDDVPTENHGIGYAVTSEGIKQAIEDATPDNLSDLNDVSISSPTNNQALVWDAENNKWTNGEVSTVGNLDDLNDVDTTGKATGDSLRYDGNSWVAKPTTYQIEKADFDQISDFTPYANSHIVVPDEPNLNPDASDIEYTSGVSVKQAIDSKADTSEINDLYVVGTIDYTLPSAITVNANGYKEICLMADAIPVGSIFLDASVPNNNGGYLFFQIGYYGNYYIVARNFTGSAITLNANQIISIRYMYKPNL